MKRIEKARRIAEMGLTKVQQYDSQGRPTVVTVPGSESKSYDVIIRRNGKLTTECNVNTPGGYVPCNGNTYGNVCYHSLAAIITVSDQNGHEISAICEKPEHAELISRIGGRVLTVASEQGPHEMYLVIEKK